MNIAVSALTGLALQTVMDAIDDYIYGTERMIQTGKESKAAVEKINKEYLSFEKTATDLSKKYDELSKGVRQFNGELSNVSLSESDYAEFLEVNNALADMFPSLSTGLDANNNAILNIGTNAQSAAVQIRDMFEAENELSNYKKSQELQEVFSGAQAEIGDIQKEINKLDEENSVSKDIPDLENGEINLDDYLTNSEFKLPNNIKGADSIVSSFKNGLTELNKLYITGPDESFRWFNSFVLTNDERLAIIEKIKKDNQELFNTASEEIKENTHAIEQEKYKQQQIWQETLPTIYASLDNIPAFSVLDSNMQNAVKIFLQNLDISNLPEDTDFEDYLKQTFVYPIANAKPHIQKAYANLFSLRLDDSLTVSQYKKTVDNLIAEIAGTDPEAQRQLRLDLGIDFKTSYGAVESPLSNQIQEVLDKNKAISEKALSGLSMEDFHIAYDLVVNDGFTDAFDELGYAIDKYKDEMQTLSASEPLSYSQILSLAPQIEEAVKSIQDAFGKGLNNELTAMDMSSLNEQFTGVPGLEHYIKAIEQAEGDTSALEEACNSLFAAFLNSSSLLDNLTEDSAVDIISLLSSFGITNAEGIVKNRLAIQQEFLNSQNVPLSGASREDIQNFLEAGDTSIEAAEAIGLYGLEKAKANGISLDTDSDISYFKTLLTACGVASKALITFGEIRKNELNGNGEANEQYDTEALWNDFQAEIDTAVENNKEAKNNLPKLPLDLPPSPPVQPSSPVTGGLQNTAAEAKKAGEEIKKSFEKLYGWMEVRLKRVADKTKHLADLAKNAFKDGRKQSYYKRAVKETGKQIDQNQKGYTHYMQEADAIGLSENYKQKIRNGEIEQETVTDEVLAKQIDEYKNFYDKAMECKYALTNLRAEMKEYAEALYNVPLERAKKNIEELSKALDVLNAQYDASATAAEKNANLDKQVQNKKKQKREAEKAAEKLRKPMKQYSSQDEKDALDKARKRSGRLLLKVEQEHKTKKRTNKDGTLSLKGLKGEEKQDVQSFNKAKKKENKAKKAYQKVSYKDEEQAFNRARRNVVKASARLTPKALEAGDKDGFIDIGKIKNKKQKDYARQYNNALKKQKKAEERLKKAKKDPANYLEGTGGKEVSTDGLKGKALEQAISYNAVLKASKEAEAELAIADAKLTQTLRDNARQKLANIREEHQAAIDLSNAYADKAKAAVSLKEAHGQTVTAKDYEDVILYADMAAEQAKEQLDAVQKQYDQNVREGVYKDDPVAQQKALTELSALEKGWIEAQAAAAGYIKEQKQLNINNLEAAITSLEKLSARYEKLLSLRQAQGLEATDEEILNQIDRNNALIEEKTKELAEYQSMLADAQANGADADIRSYQDQITDLSGSILELKTANEDLNNGLFDIRIKALNDEKEALQKLNEVKDRNLALEKAAYELEKAGQRTDLVFDGSQFVYQRNEEEYKKAEEKLEDLKFEELIHSIEDNVDALEKLKDAFNLYDKDGNALDINTVLQGSRSGTIPKIV